ncbi:hypothetical protein BHM03_00029363 [Ensete ventricosum]|nr:hypothetical protein BHM03_00029363 [Ensete ventricosum]
MLLYLILWTRSQHSTIQPVCVGSTWQGADQADFESHLGPIRKPSSRGQCVPNEAPLTTKLAFGGGDSNRDSEGPERFKEKREEVGSQKKSLPLVSIGEADDRKYDAQSSPRGLRPSVFRLSDYRGSCPHGPQANMSRLTDRDDVATNVALDLT